MPLSEEELRLLEQMERALVAEDPKLASTMRGSRFASPTAPPRLRRRRRVRARRHRADDRRRHARRPSSASSASWSCSVRPTSRSTSWRGQTSAPDDRVAARPARSVHAHRRRPQQQARLQAGPRPVRPARVDDGAVRAALAPPSRPERLLTPRTTTKDPASWPGPSSFVRTRIAWSTRRLRWRGPRRARRAGGRPAPPSQVLGAPPGGERGRQPGRAGAALAAGPGPQRGHAGVDVVTGGRHLGRGGRDLAGVAGHLDQPHQPLERPRRLRVGVRPARLGAGQRVLAAGRASRRTGPGRVHGARTETESSQAMPRSTAVSRSSAQRRLGEQRRAGRGLPAPPTQPAPDAAGEQCEQRRHQATPRPGQQAGQVAAGSAGPGARGRRGGRLVDAVQLARQRRRRRGRGSPGPRGLTSWRV